MGVEHIYICDGCGVHSADTTGWLHKEVIQAAVWEQQPDPSDASKTIAVVVSEARSTGHHDLCPKCQTEPPA